MGVSYLERSPFAKRLKYFKALYFIEIVSCTYAVLHVICTLYIMCFFIHHYIVIVGMLKNKCAMDFDPIADQDTPIHSFFISSTSHAKITSWNVAVDDKVRRGVVLLSYALHDGDGVQSNCNKDGQLKSTIVGVVRETLFKVGEMVPPG